MNIDTQAAQIGLEWDTRILMTFPEVQTHADIPPARLGINDVLLCLSVGIENIDELINDLDQAFTSQGVAP